MKKRHRKCCFCERKVSFIGWDGSPEYCIDYEMKGSCCAKRCRRFKYKKPVEECDDRYASACRGDYSPSHPWDAPGMSISDFI